MNSNLHLQFNVDREKRTITVKREFEAPLPIVWDAYTRSELLDQWWAPQPWKARTKRMDFREGGQWLYAMVGPQNEDHWSIANYKKIEHQTSFSAEDAFTDSEGKINKDMPQSKWNVRFSNKGEHTLVELLITYPEPSQLESTLQMGFQEGLSKGMENLDALLPSLVQSRH